MTAGAIPDFFWVNQDEIRLAGNVLLGLVDDVHTARAAGSRLDVDLWGGEHQVATAAAQFRDRLDHLLKGGIARELDDAGHELRLTAEGYDWADEIVRMRLESLGEQSWP